MTDQPLIPGPMPQPRPSLDAVDPMGAPEPAAEAPAKARADRKRLLVLGGAAALLVAGGGAYLLTSGGSADTAAPVAVVHHRLPHKVLAPAAAKGRPAAPARTSAPGKAAPVAPAKGQPQALAAVPPTFTGTHVRDPFRPLISPPPPPAPKPAPAPAAASASQPGSATGSSATGGSTGAGSTAARAGHDVTLLGASGRTVTAMVDGTRYTAAVGQVFATFFKAVAVQGSCATLNYGDTAFDLCTGHKVHLQ